MPDGSILIQQFPTAALKEKIVKRTAKIRAARPDTSTIPIMQGNAWYYDLFLNRNLEQAKQLAIELKTRLGYDFNIDRIQDSDEKNAQRANFIRQIFKDRPYSFQGYGEKKGLEFLLFPKDYNPPEQCDLKKGRFSDTGSFCDPITTRVMLELSKYVQLKEMRHYTTEQQRTRQQRLTA